MYVGSERERKSVANGQGEQVRTTEAARSLLLARPWGSRSGKRLAVSRITTPAQVRARRVPHRGRPVRGGTTMVI